MATEFICIEIWVNGRLKFRFRVRKDTSTPMVTPSCPFTAKTAPSTATST